MRVLVAISCVLCTSAVRADDPRWLPLADQAMPLLGDHLRILPLRGAELGASADRFVFDWGTARLTMRAYATDLAGTPGLKRSIVRDLTTQGANLAGASIQELALGAPLVGFEVLPRRPPRAGELLYAAYIASPDGLVDILAFYVDEGGVRDPAAWTAVARRIAQTAAEPPRVAVTVGHLTVDLPPGSAARASEGSYEVDVPGLGTCRLLEMQRPPHLERRTRWHHWSDTDGLDDGQSGDVVLTCFAQDDRKLARLRYLFAALSKRG